ncbi:MAG: hypothetical protein JWM44_4225 [Bacilli bacterium]|nr:hypothetical protein [Bacilli bacterium]
MKIKCPQCSATNDLQKYCGNCGSKLLIEGVEIESLEHAATAEIENEPFIELSSNINNDTGLVRFGNILLKVFDAIIFFVINVKLVFVGASHLNFIISDLLSFKRRYFYLTCISLYFFA